MQTTVVRNKFNNKIVISGVKFAISFVDASDELHTVFIHKLSMMSDTIPGYNRLPKEIVKNEKILCKHFEEESEKHNLFYSIKVFEDNIDNTNE